MNDLANKETRKHNPLPTGMISALLLGKGVRRIDKEEEGKKQKSREEGVFNCLKRR